MKYLNLKWANKLDYRLVLHVSDENFYFFYSVLQAKTNFPIIFCRSPNISTWTVSSIPYQPFDGFSIRSKLHPQLYLIIQGQADSLRPYSLNKYFLLHLCYFNWYEEVFFSIHLRISLIIIRQNAGNVLGFFELSLLSGKFFSFLPGWWFRVFVEEA